MRRSLIARAARALGIPLVTLQFRRSARRLRSHISLWIYLGLAGGSFTLFWFILTNEAARPGMRNNGGDIMETLFGLFAAVQAVWLGTSALLAGDAAVNEEASRTTEEVLLCTPLRSIAILAGKAGATVLQLGIYVLLLLPFYALMMLEGGLSPMQTAAAAVLTIVLVSWAVSWSLLAAVMLRKRNAGLTFGFNNLLLGTMLLFLLQNLSAALGALRPSWRTLPVPTMSDAAWSHVNLVKAYAEVASGSGVVISGALPTVLLAHVGLALAGCSALLLAAAWLYRPRAAMGKVKLRTALWRMIRKPRQERTPPRRSWERGSVRPWRGALAWRALAPRASVKPRLRWWAISFLLTVALLFIPLVIFAFECGVAYTACALEEVAAGRGLPPLPEGSLLHGGAMRYLPRAATPDGVGRTVRTAWGREDLGLPGGGYYRSSEDAVEMVKIWLAGCSVCVAGALPVVFGFLLSGVGARERETKRLELLLALPAESRELAQGCIAEAIRPLLGILAGIAFVVVVAVTADLLPFSGVVLVLLYIGMVSLFLGAAALRFSFTSSSVRASNSKLIALYVFLQVAFPMLVGLLAILSETVLGSFDDDRILPLLGLSPVTLLGFSVAIIHQEPMPDNELVLGVVAGFAFYGILGLVGLDWGFNAIRELARRRL